ncbi:radical SAM protein [bacterium]|nr:radical SAM protein [bacterium]
MVKKTVIPKRIQLETYYGCNAKCIMCAVSLPPTRKKGIMPIEMSNYVLDELAPYAEHIEKLDLFGLGEPLLDPYIFERIKYAKEKGFRNIAISTNADLLNKEKQKKLLETHIDTVLFSIDGAKKETHEKIRVGVNFERVVENCQSIIKIRDEYNYTTRFVMRFICQDSNKDECGIFKKFWLPKLSEEKGDMLIVYDVNTMGGEIYSKEELIKNEDLDPDIEKKSCHMIFDRLIVLNNGSVPLCCEDTPKAKYCLGNVQEYSPIEIFNCEKLNKIRKIHLESKKNTIDLCRGCTVLYSEKRQKRI